MTTRHHPETERPLHEPLQVFDLTAHAEQLRSEPAWTAGRNAITLRKAPGMQLVLLAMQAGDHLREHHAPGPITLHAIRGRVRFTTADQSVELVAQTVVALDGGISHTVEALEESLCLLTIGSVAQQ